MLGGTVTEIQLIAGLSETTASYCENFVKLPFLVFTAQKAQTENGKRFLPTKKELNSYHLCLHTTDQSYAQDSANLQHFISCETSWSRTR